MRRILLITLAISGALLGSSRAAHAASDIVCGLVEHDVIAVDGMLDDWQGVKSDRWTGENARDATMLVRCNYDPTTLFISVDITDDQLIRRGKKDHGAEDALAIVFANGSTLLINPGDSDHTLPRKVKGAGKGVEIADSLQPKGWSVELALPRARVPGWQKGVTTITATVEFRDADLYSENGFQETISTGAGATLTLEEGASLFTQFLDDQHLKAKDVWLDTMANMDGAPGNERVVVAGRLVGILGSEYAYMQLPVPRKDVLEVKVIDLAGEGKSAILARYVERGNGGQREIVAVWNLMPDGSFVRPFAHELSKEAGSSKMTNSYSLDAKKKKKGKKLVPGKGFDIVVVPGTVTGFSADTWNEEPAADLSPIILPWSDVKKERYVFTGNECAGGPE